MTLLLLPSWRVDAVSAVFPAPPRRRTPSYTRRLANGDRVRAIHRVWSERTRRTMHDVVLPSHLRYKPAGSALVSVRRVIADPAAGCRATMMPAIAELFGLYWPADLPWPADIPRPPATLAADPPG